MSTRTEVRDRLMACQDCGENFVWSADEQEFFAQKGFTDPPKRCAECRRQKKARYAEREQQNGGVSDERAQ